MSSDPRKPILIGLIVMAALMLGGIIFAVVALPGSGTGRFDANVSFDDSNDPTFGPSNAKVTLRIFEDFECPACRLAEPGIEHVRQKYGDRVRIVWNDFPLESIHQNALVAANAGRCAEEQGKFWEYASALYSAQEVWSPQSDPTSSFITYAKELGMSDTAFGQCLSERRYESKIRADIREARTNRVDSTPSFFLNNTRFSGVLSPEDWDREIERALGQ